MMTPSYPFSILAADIGGTKMAFGSVDYLEPGVAPTISSAFSVPTFAGQGGASVLARLVDGLRNVQETTRFTVMGIGVGTAGCVNPDDGSIAYANDIMPGWTGQQVKGRVQSDFNLPAAVLGDVQAHAMGESRWGSARDDSSCLLVAAGTGIGGAIVLNGHVVMGAHGAAGHIGHTLHPACSGQTCGCGAQSHMETLASGSGIVAAYKAAAHCSDDIDGATIAKLAADGNAAAIDVLQQAGLVLGSAIGSWVNILDPASVIVTGSVCKAGPIWSAALQQGIDEQALPAMKPVVIKEAVLGGDAPLIGAAEWLLSSTDTK